MRTFLGLFGAIIGALFGFFLVGSAAGDLYQTVGQFESPDQAGDAHAYIFISITLAMMLFGYFVGLFIGGRIAQHNWDDVEEV